MRCLRSLLAILTVVIVSSRLIAQNPAVLPRVAGPVDESSRVVLAGSLSPIARAEFDRGQAPPSAQLSHVHLVLARTTEQQAALDTYDAQLLDKKSPNYLKWLTPQQFGKLYGPADSDVAAIVAWLESHGLRVDPVSPGRTNISFSGSVQQIEDLLHTSMHSFEVNGEQFFSNTSNPTIPAALAPLVSGVARLNTMRPKPQNVMGPMGIIDPSSGKLQPASKRGLGAPRPNLTLGTGVNSFLYVVPADAAIIYDTPNSLLNPNYPSASTSYTGTGVTIGIGGDAPITAATIAAYRKLFLNDTTHPPTISYCDDWVNTTTVPTCSGATVPNLNAGDTDEAYIDTELSGGLAPGANVHYYGSSDLDGAIQAAIDENTVDIFSLSFGNCEQNITTAGNAILNGWWQQAATQGIAVTVSTGDNGSAGCDFGAAAASGGLQVSGFASTPFNVAVGGTDFGPLLSTFSTYAGPSTANSGTSFYRTALSYIPEWTWNDSTVPNTTISVNQPFPDAANTNTTAGSGGVSSCSTNTTTNSTVGTCTHGYAKPSWQRGTNVPNDGARDIPDISLMAGAGGDAAAWLVCTDDPPTTGSLFTDNCTLQSDGNTYFTAFGGTSTSAPAFAGILAAVQQKVGHRLGQAASELYDIYNGANAAAVFHDVTIGNISVPCVTLSPNCVLNTANNLFLTGYDTGTKYDLATGIGSVDAAQLVKFWGSTVGPATTTVTVAPSSGNISRSSPLTVTVTVKGATVPGNPTGTVILAGGGFTSAAQSLTASGTDSGTATINVPANSLNAGNITLTASYSGDGNYGAQTGTAAVVVTLLTPTVTVTPTPASIGTTQALSVAALVTGAGVTPTGTVKLTSGTYASASLALTAGAATFNVPAGSLAVGNDTLTVTYSGDSTYNTVTGTAPETVIQSTFTVAATTPGAVNAGTSGTSTITLTPVAGYTGTVTLTAAVTTAPAGAVGTPTFTIVQPPAITSAAVVTGTVTVNSTAATAARKGPSGSAWFQAAGGTALAAFLLFFVPLGSRRGRRILSLMLIVAAATFTAVGCGGGGSHPNPKTTPSVTVSPSKSAISSDTAITVAVSVSGGTQTATGNVTLTGGGFTGAATSLSAGAATINIPANSLTASTTPITLTASYAGDTNYNAATGTTTVTVSKPKTTPGAYTITVTATGNDTAHTTKTATFTLQVN